MKVRATRTAIVALSGVSLLSFAAPAFAQSSTASAATPDPGLISEIIVTARRREESVQDVPLVVNTVSSDSIEKLNIRSGLEIQNLVPGLQLRLEPNGVGGSGQIRGVAYDINTGAGPTVAFYLNDAPNDATAVLQSMYDVGQIEVLRGPQGTLRGTATPSGSITLTTRKPDLDNVGMNLTGTATNTGSFNLNGAMNIPIVAGMLGLRVAGLTEDTNANRVHSIDDDADLQHPSSRLNSGRVLLTFQPTDWLKVEGMYQTTQYRNRSFDQYASFSLADPTAPESAVLITPKDRQSIQESARDVNQKNQIFNWRGEARYGGQVLIYQGATTTLDVKTTTNQDFANFLPGRDIFQSLHTKSTYTSHEVRLQNEDRVLGMFDYVLGYYQTRQDARTGLITQTPILLPPFLGGSLLSVINTPVTSNGKTSDTAFFGNLTWHIGESTQLSGGLRHLSLKSSPRSLFIGTTSVPGPGVDDQSWIYSASIQHNFTRNLMVYASTGTSRRAGPSIVNTDVANASPLMQSFLFLNSEKSRSYEAGIKSTWLDGQLTANITGFYQKFDGYPYKLTTPIYFVAYTSNGAGGFVPGVGNSAQFAANVPVTVKGVEAEVNWRPSRNFNLNLVASYADGKIKNGVIPCNDLNGDGVPDTVTTAPTLAALQAAYGANGIGACKLTQRSSNQSPFSATAQAEYSVPVADNTDIFARGLYSFFGNSQVEPTNAFDDLGSYGLLNLFAGVRDSGGSWEVNFFVKNVFNTIKATRFDPPATTSYQELAPPTFRTTVGKSYTSTYSIIQTTAPREFGLSLRMALGSR